MVARISKFFALLIMLKFIIFLHNYFDSPIKFPDLIKVRYFNKIVLSMYS